MASVKAREARADDERKRAINRATSEGFRQRCIEQGLCVSCGNEPARQGKRLGLLCAKKRSDEGKARREARRGAVGKSERRAA